LQAFSNYILLKKNSFILFFYYMERISNGPNSVTIMIAMHGGILSDPLLTTPTHTALGTSPGLCILAEQFPLQQLDILTPIFKTHPIRVANVAYDDVFRERFKSVLDHLTIEQIVKDHPHEDRDEIAIRYTVAAQRPTGVRRYMYNQLYTITDGILATKQGIFIVHTNSDNLELHQDLIGNDLVVPDISDPFLTQSDYFKLQNLNLINVAVATQFYAKSNPYGDLESSTEFSGVDHYKSITLNHILKFFGDLGIEHVNIIDIGCRVFIEGLPLPAEVARAISAEELDEGSKLGGKRKTRRKGRKIRTRSRKRRN
jgi:hypothetical protein